MRYGLLIAALLGMSLAAGAANQKLTGTVTGPDGKAVAEAEVILIPGHMRGGQKTDREGRFELTWDPEAYAWVQGDFSLMVLQEEENLAGVAPVSTDTEDVEVRLQKGAGVKGRVVDPDGKPIDNAQVSLIFFGSNFGTSFGKDMRTDNAGFYEFACLPVDQRFYVNVSDAAGYGSGDKQFTAEASETPLEIETIVLPIADLKVSGQVVDVEGKGLADVQLFMHGSGQPNSQVKTDKEGRFVFENVCAGRLFISASYQDRMNTYLHGSVTTEGGAEDVRLVIGAESTGQFVPRRPASLVGKPLGEALAANGVELPADPNSAAVFVWDMNQRPSRHFIKAFAEKAALLEASGTTAVLLQAGPVERAALEAWLQENAIVLPCGVMGGKVEEAKFKLGVRGLPWLILTDAEGKVVAEGISVEELENRLKPR